MKARTVVVTAIACVIALTTGCSQPTASPAAAPAKTNPFGRKIAAQERWAFSDPKAVEDLQGTTFGEQEINEFWTRKGWKLTKRDEAYLATVDALARDGYITKVSRWAKCPYNPVYQALVGVDVLGAHVKPGQEFNLEMDAAEGEVQLGKPRFVRAKTYEEDHNGGHSTDAARN